MIKRTYSCVVANCTGRVETEGDACQECKHKVARRLDKQRIEEQKRKRKSDTCVI